MENSIHADKLLKLNQIIKKEYKTKLSTICILCTCTQGSWFIRLTTVSKLSLCVSVNINDCYRRLSLMTGNMSRVHPAYKLVAEQSQVSLLYV